MLLSALVLGLMGSLHCVGMCGPIAFMLPVIGIISIKKQFRFSFTILEDYWHMALLVWYLDYWERDLHLWYTTKTFDYYWCTHDISCNHTL